MPRDRPRLGHHQPGRLVGRGRVVHKGRAIAFLEAKLSTEEGELVATGTATARIVQRETG